VPNPQTPYATQFIADCQGQQWFMNFVEQYLNSRQQSINTLTDNYYLTGIKTIGLRDSNISGQIPKAIGQLTGLTDLLLADNKLANPIPEELYSLPILQNVDLSDNQFTGSIPSEFGTMPALDTLLLKGNTYSGTIPSTILSNTKMKVLDLSSNKLTGGIPAGITAMTNLEYLALSDNPLGGQLIDFTPLTKLMTLSLWGDNLTGTIPKSLYTMNTLEILDLAVNNFTGDIDGVENLTNLQLLAIGANKLTGDIPAGITNITGLQTVDLADNQLDSTLPTNFDAMTNLEAIYLQNNMLRGTVSDSLKAKSDAGVTVDLENNSLTGSNLVNMPLNKNNFDDGATTTQYQLGITTPVTLTVGQEVNIYPKLFNKGSPTKAVLPPTDYAVAPSSDYTVRIDSTGIYITALTDSASTQLTINILGNDGSARSTALEMANSNSSGGGGGGGNAGGGGSIIQNTTAPVASPIASSVPMHEPYITGYPDGSFKPDQPITREEAVTMVLRALGINVPDTTKSSYSDVNSDRWSLKYIEDGTTLGYLLGFPNGTFEPGNNMTRAEFATFLSRIPTSISTNKSMTFSDVTSDKWYYTSIEDVAAKGIIQGYPDGTFKPDATITRAEAVTMVNRLVGRVPNKAELDALGNPFNDLNPDHWAYYDILEAAVAHKNLGEVAQ